MRVFLVHFEIVLMTTFGWWSISSKMIRRNSSYQLSKDNVKNNSNRQILMQEKYKNNNVIKQESKHKIKTIML